MNLEDQRNAIRLQREQLIRELEVFYQNTFTKLSTLDIGERSITKLTQLLLQSREAAITPLRKEVERPLITKAPKES